MRIESEGIRITDIPFLASIRVTQDEFFLVRKDGNAYLSLTEMTQLRNALDAALEEHAKLDTAITTPAHAHRASCHGSVGELLCGER